VCVCVCVCVCVWVGVGGSQNKHRLIPYRPTALTGWFYNPDGLCLLRGTDLLCKRNQHI